MTPLAIFACADLSGVKMKWRIVVKQDGKIYTDSKLYDIEKRHIAVRTVQHFNHLKDTEAHLEPIVEPSDR